jgi:hypothetical protein
LGLFYANLTIHGVERASLLTEFRRLQHAAFIGPTINGFTTIFDQIIDEQKFEDIEELGCTITQTFACTAIASVLHDDDVLYLWLFHKGQISDFYNSLPGYFDSDAGQEPEGGNAQEICRAFNCIDRIFQVEHILRANLLEDEMPEILGEQERHKTLCELLGLPPFVAALGYTAIQDGYIPAEFQGIQFEQI